MTVPPRTATQVRDRLAGLPGGPELIEVASGRDDVFLVGGVVRDLLLDRPPRELDVLVEGEVEPVAQALAGRLSGRVTAHERFGTATVEGERARVDLARSRAESYERPGALPTVRAAPLAEDLGRRDFTVNAMAVPLGAGEGRDIVAVPHARDDLRAGRLRVLHEASFQDDPTRLLRLGRYRARLGFSIERRTRALAARAVRSGALSTVSEARVGAELRLALVEPRPADALASLAELGILAALAPALAWDPELARRVGELVPQDGDGGLALLAASAIDVDPDTLGRWLDRLEFTARERDVVVVSATRARALAEAMAGDPSPSELAMALRRAPPEGVALAGALGPAGVASRWLDDLRHVKLEIGGDDLIAAGVPAGPVVGRALDAALALKLDGRLAGGRDAELHAALEAARIG